MAKLIAAMVSTGLLLFAYPEPDETETDGTPKMTRGSNTSRSLDRPPQTSEPCDPRIVTLQASGGPNWWGQRKYSGGGVSTALVVNGSVYLVDMADGIGAQWAAAGLEGTPRADKLQRLRAAFVTHMHTDHISGLPVLMAQGSNPAPIAGGAGAPSPMYGPFAVEPGMPPPGAPPGASAGRGGIVEVFAAQELALAVDLRVPPRSFLKPVAIELPADVARVASPAQPFPPMAPFLVHRDDSVSVYATLVNHFYPSFAYRFDLASGQSVVISGDTNRDTNGNLERLAKGADVLLLEVFLGTPLRFAVDALATAFPSVPHLRVTYTGVDRPLGPETEIALFRVIQEAITNALKHSGAAEIEVELVYEPDFVHVVISDNGQGSDAFICGNGIRGMRERMSSIGGTLTIEGRSEAGGWRVAAAVPISRGGSIRSSPHR